MEIIFLGIAGFIVVFLVLIYLRKLQWDAIHNNLYDLVDDIGGNIIRHGFATRPIYHGNYEGNELTINFSAEKTKKGRLNYIDISLNTQIQSSLTIASVKWLEENNAELLNNFVQFNDNNINRYGISIENSRDIDASHLEKKIKNYIINLDNFNFIFFGGTGVLFELECDNVAFSTKHPKLKKNIVSLINLVKAIN